MCYSIPSSPELTGYQLPLPALGAARLPWSSLHAARKVLWGPWEWLPARSSILLSRMQQQRAAEEVFPLGSDVHLLPQPSIWNSGSHFSLLPINIADLLLYTWWVVNCIPPLL